MFHDSRSEPEQHRRLGKESDGPSAMFRRARKPVDGHGDDLGETRLGSKNLQACHGAELRHGLGHVLVDRLGRAERTRTGRRPRNSSADARHPGPPSARSADGASPRPLPAAAAELRRTRSSCPRPGGTPASDRCRPGGKARGRHSLLQSPGREPSRRHSLSMRSGCRTRRRHREPCLRRPLPLHTLTSVGIHAAHIILSGVEQGHMRISPDVTAITSAPNPDPDPY